MKPKVLQSSFVSAALVCATLLAASVFIRVHSSPSARINLERLDQVMLGMTLKEVEAVFGLPPGDYSGGMNQSTPWRRSTDGWEPGLKIIEWTSETASCMVIFDASGRAVKTAGNGVLRFTWFQQIRNWLGL
jgi:hypothetical protein